MSTKELPVRTVRLAAGAVYAIFFLSGFNFANWASRIPAVRDLLGFDPAQMGRLVLVAAVGSIIALPLSGWIVQRIGARRAIAIFAGVNAVGFTLAAWGVVTGALVPAVLGLFLSGIGIGVWDAAMNLEGAVVEQHLGKAIMPRFHASFSFGTMAGAGVGAVASRFELSLLVHMGAAAGLAFVLVLVAVPRLLPDVEELEVRDGAPAPAKHNPFGAWLEPRTLLIGLVVLAAALTEGAANDWLSIAVVDGFEVEHETGAMALFVFLTAMTGMRLLGTVLLDKHGRVFVLRLSAGFALVGLLVFGLVPWLPLALVGVVLWGMGAALGFPVGMSAASDDPVRAAGRLSVVTTIGYTAFFAGPPVLGELAQHVGYRNALLAIAVPVLLGLLVTHVAAQPDAAEPEPGRDPEPEHAAAEAG